MDKSGISKYSCKKFAKLIDDPEDFEDVFKIEIILKYVRIYLDLINEDHPEPNPRVTVIN